MFDRCCVLLQENGLFLQSSLVQEKNEQNNEMTEERLCPLLHSVLRVSSNISSPTSSIQPLAPLTPPPMHTAVIGEQLLTSNYEVHDLPSPEEGEVSGHIEQNPTVTAPLLACIEFLRS